MRRLVIAPIVAAVFLFSGPLLAAESSVSEVSAWLTGTFDNREQASRDAAGFAETRLVSVLVPKSRIGLGAPVLYLEEALAGTTDRPFVRRFVRIEEIGAGKFSVRLFEPKDPIAVSGKWRDSSDLALFGLTDVVERSGCLVTLRKIDDHYDGVSEGMGCPWPLGGSRYLVTRMDVYAGKLGLWERGFDGTGLQVWGPAKGPLLFVKRSDNPPVESSPAPAPTAHPSPQPTPISITLNLPAPTPATAVVAATAPTEAVAAPAPVAVSAPPVTAAETPAPQRSASGALQVPVPPAVMAPVFPSDLLTPALLVRGLGADRNLDLAEIRSLPMTTLRQRAAADGKKGALSKGVPLIEILRRCGLRTDGMDVRRLLAPAVILATGSDGYTATFSIEELLVPGGGAILILEGTGATSERSNGPFQIVEPAKVRSVRDVRSLELRILATNPPEAKS